MGCALGTGRTGEGDYSLLLLSIAPGTVTFLRPFALFSQACMLSIQPYLTPADERWPHTLTHPGLRALHPKQEGKDGFKGLFLPIPFFSSFPILRALSL